VRKNGFKNGKQQYKCYTCRKNFLGGFRIESARLWQEFVEGKQTYVQLAFKYGCSTRTIQRKIDAYVVSFTAPKAREVIVLMDTTYWGRNFGVMLFKDSISGQNLLKYYVKYETNALYQRGIIELKDKGFSILAIVCDGRKGLTLSFKEIPVQMCQFHQAAILRRLQSARELMEVADLLKQTDKESFTGALQMWFDKWQWFLDERSTNPATGKTFYTHKRLRSAARSLKNNLPWLFTWYDNLEIGIPNTTNAIDGHFADLKNKLRNHNGLSENRKRKFVDEFLKA
jgi:hypothetical protein